MKKIILLFVCCIGIGNIYAQTHKLEKLWESKESLPTPESVLFDEQRKLLYVSLIDGAANEKDAKGGIALLNLDGSLKDSDWITGLNAPKGMALFNDVLYVADIDVVWLIDVVTANVIDEIKVAGSTFLNDVAVDDNGVVFVSDTRENKIFQIRNGNASLYLDNVPSVNGLRVVDGDLLALAGPEIWRINGNKKSTVIVKGFEKGGDGIEPIGNGDYLVTCWPGLIYYVKASGAIEKIQDVQGQMNTADLGYNAKDRILYIPTFSSNSVIAYKLK